MRKNESKYESGDKYGFVMLTGKSYIGDHYNRYVEFICECGTIKWARFYSLTSGRIKSCGCFNKSETLKRTVTHGLTGHPLHNIWFGIKARCYDTNLPCYKYYGGNGVTVCDEWRNDFKVFYDWAIANGWEPGLELDKDKLSPFKTGKIYSPEYCCFLTKKENMRNRSDSRTVNYEGKEINLSELCENLGVNYSLVRERLGYGWTIERAIREK